MIKNSITTHFKSISIWLSPPSKGLICHHWWSCYREGQFSQSFMSFNSSCPSLLSVLMPRQPAPPHLVVFLGLLQAARWCSAASLNCWVSTAGFISAIPRIREQTYIALLYVQTRWARNTERELLQPQSSVVTFGLFSKVFMTHTQCESSAQRPSLFLSWLRSLSLMFMFPPLIELFLWKHCWSAVKSFHFSGLLSLNTRKDLSWVFQLKLEGRCVDWNCSCVGSTSNRHIA